MAKPLTTVALAALRKLKDYGPRPTVEFNPGVCAKLQREKLVTIEMRKYPPEYSTKRNGETCSHLALTREGDLQLMLGSPVIDD